jgi:hypothetical protein
MNQGRLDRGVQLLRKPFTRAQLEAKLDQVLGPDTGIAPVEPFQPAQKAAAL